MSMSKCFGVGSAAVMLTAALAFPAAAQSAKAALKDKSGKDVGTAELM